MGGEYCKGRGREAEVWRKDNHKSKLYIPFERAVGNRQDLKTPNGPRLHL